jgi:Dioxygenases related to 2-nitropropane dioxygenase
MKTRITELLGVKYPIVQGGMMWVGTAEMASAVSNAGGFGIITALTQPTPEALAQEIRKCREMTDKPFGVNLTLLPSISPPPYEEYCHAAVDTGITVFETAGRSPEPFMPFFKEHGVKVIHKCTSVRHSLKAEKLGVDAVSVDGFECAGHPGEDDVTNLVLLAAASEKLTIPFLASGGIGNGYQMAAVMALGAEGVNMGSRFVATLEAPVHPNMKQAMVDADERSTKLIFRTLKNTARVYANSISEQVVNIEAEDGPTDFTDLKDLVAGVRGRERCIENGDINDGIWTVGQVMGLINDIPTCKELIDRMIAEAQEAVLIRLKPLLGIGS